MDICEKMHFYIDGTEKGLYDRVTAYASESSTSTVSTEMMNQIDNHLSTLTGAVIDGDTKEKSIRKMLRKALKASAKLLSIVFRNILQKKNKIFISTGISLPIFI